MAVIQRPFWSFWGGGGGAHTQPGLAASATLPFSLTMCDALVRRHGLSPASSPDCRGLTRGLL